MIKTKQEILEILKFLPIPLVGGVCYDSNNVQNLRDVCYEMFKEVCEISNPIDILEFGTHSGSASLMLLSLSNANLTSIDIGNTWIGIDHGYEDWGYARMGHGLQRVSDVLCNYFPNKFRLLIGDSTQQSTIDRFNDRKFQLIFIDANHDYDFVKKDVETAIKLNIPYILLDDLSERDGPDDARARVARELNLILVKKYPDIHNVANIGCALFKNPDYKE